MSSGILNRFVCPPYLPVNANFVMRTSRILFINVLVGSTEVGN